MKYRIHYTADCEGDWFSDDADSRLYDSRQEAEQAVRDCYRGPDELGNEAHFEIQAIST